LYRRQLQAEDAARIDRIVTDAVEPEPTSSAGATAGGDPSRLRGIPAVGRGTSGAVFDTDPARALLAKDRRRGR
jgi:hypothetical protein